MAVWDTITVVSGRSNVVKDLKRTLPILEEIDILLACRQSQLGFIWFVKRALDRRTCKRVSYALNWRNIGAPL
jgi:hypothetical protein